MREAATATPDGQTLVVVAVGNTVVAPLLADDVGYEYDDFASAGGIYELPSVLTVADDSVYERADELIDEAKKKPGEIKLGTPGSKVYDAEMMRLAEFYDAEFTLVPFDGTSDAVAALLGGNVDALFSDASSAVLSQVEDGAFRALATGAAEEVPYLEDVPTFVSLGYPELTLTSNVFGLAAPVDTPDSIMAVLEGGMEACTTDPDVADVYGKQYAPDEFVPGEEVDEDLEKADEEFAPFLSD